MRWWWGPLCTTCRSTLSVEFLQC